MPEPVDIEVRAQKIRQHGFWVGYRATARHVIPDSPLSWDNGGARRGDTGTIEDIDWCDGWLLVDFGRGAIIVDPDEVT